MTGLRFFWRTIFLLWIVAFLAACSAAAPAGAPYDETAGGPRPVAGTGDEASDEQPEQPPDGENQQVSDPALIVHTGSMSFEVTELRSAVEQANALIAGLGGHVAASHELSTTSEQTASVTYRIPAARWAEAVAGLRGLGHRVLAETTEAEDVTAQVVDLDARIANLRASETALQTIMQSATTIDDVLRVQRELTTVRGDIESMTAQRDLLADRAALGTLNVTFEVPVIETRLANQGWDLGHEIDSAVASLVRVAQGLASVAIWLGIVVVPIVVPLMILAYLAIRIRRRLQPSPEAQGPIAPSV